MTTGAKLTRQGVRDLGGNKEPKVDPRRTPVFGVFDGRPRVAVDVQVSSKSIDDLEKAGFFVAVVAQDGEPDHIWLARAEQAKVDIVCSPDKEVCAWAKDRGLLVARLYGNRGDRAVSFVRRAWRNQ